jgi:hypothetical protein
MTENLSALVPIAISAAMLTSSTVTEAEYPAWSAGTTYTSGQFCLSTATHRVYQSQADGNLNKDPTDPANQVSVGTVPVYWIDYGPTNKFALFDDQVNTQTAVASPLTVVLTPGGFDAFWLGALDAESLTVTVKDAPGGNVIFSATSTLEASAPGDYDEYFFSPFRPQTDFLASGIDHYSNAELTVTLARSSGQVKCGMLAVGSLAVLGPSQRGVKVKPKTYSYIDMDKYGITRIRRRKAAVDMDASARIDLSDASYVGGVLRSLQDEPAVWIGASSAPYTDLRVFGLGSGDINYDQPQSCLLTINVKGMI